jgi:metal-responsive CopG/Arc/MetJ family transcriptional regulator
MKTAISVNTSLFERAERYAKEKKISRSRLFAEAMEEYLEKREKDKIIEQINKVCAEVDTSLDPFWKEVQGRAVSKDEW